uniref:ATP-dependent DNA helicase n=1 Tax=Anopheles atroparvus TaxID=41427 RepID=A0A182ISL1_ANOAO
MFDTMQYPLFHPYGEVGWSNGIPKRRRGANQRITMVSDSVATAANDDGAESSTLWPLFHVLRITTIMHVHMASNFGQEDVDVAAINTSVLQRMPHPVREYLSVDTVQNNVGRNVSGIPMHRLLLAQNSPVLLMRNFNAERGLCNGTRPQIPGRQVMRWTL